MRPRQGPHDGYTFSLYAEVHARVRHAGYMLDFLRRNAFAITDTEEKLIAALAIIGLRSSPNIGYSTPAAIGTPTAL